MAGMPTEPTLHGAPVRQYLNTKVTGHLLEGMKMLAKEQYVCTLFRCTRSTIKVGRWLVVMKVIAN